MKLPKSLTTVTPFSKILALAIFILFILAGLYAGEKYGIMQQQLHQTSLIAVQKDNPSNIPTDPSALNVPSFHSPWHQLPQDQANAYGKEVLYYETQTSLIPLTIRGTLWTKTIPLNALNSYQDFADLFAIDSQKVWQQDTTIQQYKLLPIAASGPCGHEEGLISHQGNKLRVYVSEIRVGSCQGDGGSYVDHIPYHTLRVFESDVITENQILSEIQNTKE